MDEKRIKEIFALFNKTNVLVIGDSMLDVYISGTADRISPEAPIPVILKRKEDFKVGGAANVALNLAMLGAKVTLLTAANPDDAGKVLLQILDAHGIKIILGNSNHTIVKTRVIAHNQQVVRVDEENPRETYKFILNSGEIEFIKQAIEENQVILFSDYNKGAITQELLDLVVNLSNNKGKFVALDPKPSNKLKFVNLDLITPNEKEANELVDTHNASTDELFIRLDERYKTKLSVITLGEKGMGFYGKGIKPVIYPSLAKEVYDVCGAGDTAISLLSLTLSNKIPIDEAAYLSNIACGIVVGKHGTATTNQQEILSWAAKSN